MSEFLPPFGGGGVAASAVCAVHAEQSARAICARCGNFMCAACTDNGLFDACPSCRALTGEIPGFTWSRDSFSLDGLLSFCWEHFKREWVMLSLAGLVFGVVLIGVGMVGNILQAIGSTIHPIASVGFAIIGRFVQTVVQGVLTGGLCVVLYHVIKGESADVGRLFGQFSNLATYAVLAVIEFVLMLIPISAIGAVLGVVYFATRDSTTVIMVGVVMVLLAIVPLLWLFLPFELAIMEVALGGETSGSQAMKNAFQLARGMRLWLFVFAFVAAIVAVAGSFACCIGILPAMAFGQMLKLTLYLALRNGSGLPPMRGQLS